MGVDTKHPKYEEYAKYWGKMRDCVAGATHVKNAKTFGQIVSSGGGEIYLPKLAGQDDTEYGKYKNRAWWYPATGRTVQGYLGTIFRKPENSDLGGIEPNQKNIDGQGTSLISFARDCVNECLQTGRFIIAATFSNDMPVLRLYSAEQLINWNQDEFYVLANNRVEIEDFEWKFIDQRLVFKKDGGRWVYEVWERTDSLKEFTKTEEHGKHFIAREKPLGVSPVIVSGWSSVSADLELPPLIELADLNLSHYRNSADHENAIHFCGLPQPWVSGVRAREGEVWNVGTPEAWAINDPAGRAGYMEMTGQGVQKIADAMIEKERRMAAIGARMLEGQRNQVETAETARIRQAGEMGSLTTIANTCSEAIQESLGVLSRYIGEKPESIEFQLNTDFVDSPLSPQEMVQLMQVWQGGGISQDTYLWNLHKGERLEGTIEDEKLKISLEDPLKVVAGGANDDQSNFR